VLSGPVTCPIQVGVRAEFFDNVKLHFGLAQPPILTCSGRIPTTISLEASVISRGN
jgi:hypothetical protein